MSETCKVRNASRQALWTLAAAVRHLAFVTGRRGASRTASCPLSLIITSVFTIQISKIKDTLMHTQILCSSLGAPIGRSVHLRV